MRRACSWMVIEPPVCKHPPFSDARFFWLRALFDRNSGWFHLASKLFHTLSNIQWVFFPVFLASMKISESLWEAFVLKIFLIFSSCSGLQATFLYKYKLTLNLWKKNSFSWSNIAPQVNHGSTYCCLSVFVIALEATLLG